MTDGASPNIFDKRCVRRRRERSAATIDDQHFLHKRAWGDIVDRLETVKRDFPRALIYGADPSTSEFSAKCGVGHAVWADCAMARLRSQRAMRMLSDEDASPIKPSRLDLVISCLTLHFSNDPVGAMTQIRRALKPDGLFVAAVFGEQTLQNLKRAFFQAESELIGGVHGRIAPFATVQDLGACLQRAGFALPVVDIDRVRVEYQNPISLLHDLRGMGETRALVEETPPLRRNVLLRALQYFAENGSEEMFDIVYLTGWAPDASQQKPLRPGSGKIALEDAVKGKPTRSPS